MSALTYFDTSTRVLLSPSERQGKMKAPETLSVLGTGLIGITRLALRKSTRLVQRHEKNVLGPFIVSGSRRRR
jgi:hypothetical protein